MTELSGDERGRIHNHLQKARSQAGGIEDPSVRRAVESLAAAVDELVGALKGRSG